MSHIEEQIFDLYTRRTDDPYKRHIDDIAAAFSGCRDETED